MLADSLLKDYDGSVNDLAETPLATFINEVLMVLEFQANRYNKCLWNTSGIIFFLIFTIYME